MAARFRSRLAALEPSDPLLEVLAERWVATTLPAKEADRRILEQAKADADARIADLYAARYERGEFPTSTDLSIFENLMARLREQRAAAQGALDKLGPRPTIDIGLLLDSELSEEGWRVPRFNGSVSC